MFDRVVAAALSETRSKFALAEALAIEIPPRRSGPSEDEVISKHIAKAVQAISDAGGEPRSISTLADYRKTALWVQGVNTPNSPTFRWVAAASFTAHNEARKVGLSYSVFAAMKTKTTDAIRAKAGKAGTDGPPTRIFESWTPAQRVEAVREAVKDPEVARAVVADHATNTKLAKARQEHDQEVQDQTDARHPDRVPLRHDSAHAADMYRLTQIRRELFQMAEKVMDRNPNRSQRVEGQEIAEEIIIAGSRVKAAFSGSIDDELAAAIAQWRNE